jgi:phasin family protein
MADNTLQFANDVQEASRSIFAAMQGLTETQIDVAQRLLAVQQNVLNQAVEVTNDQLQLISRVRDPREFANAQADLAKSHGQRYVESVKQATDIVVEAWQAYGDRLEKTINTVADKTQRASKRAT